jgi:hypothetical protein
LLGFPREIPRVKTLQDQKSRAQDRIPDEQKPHSASEFLPALKSLFTNKVFLFTTIAGTAEGFAVSGTATFIPKFLESQFHLTSSDASFSAGVVIIPGGILGMLIGGFLIRRFQWTCGQCAKACTIIAFLALFPILIFLTHCPNQDFAGVTTSYYNRYFICFFYTNLTLRPYVKISPFIISSGKKNPCVCVGGFYFLPNQIEAPKSNRNEN